MTESPWVDLAFWMLRIVGRAAFLTALVGFLAIFLNIGVPQA